MEMETKNRLILFVNMQIKVLNANLAHEEML